MNLPTIDPIRGAAALVVCLGTIGCSTAPSASAPATLMSVSVSVPIEREINDYTDFTGRTAAVDSVEVRAHVRGYLQKVNFQEGALVNKGDVLFELDARP
jgi:multidrug efflux system membrane fusion protein